MEETKRKLAHVEKIVSLDPIPGADKIEKAQVLGWECVTNKENGFKVGDLVVYFEIDSILPEKPEFEFLRERKFRIKTIKLRKQIAQGLIMPLSILPAGKYKEGDDVTDVIGVKHYDPESPLHQKVVEYVPQNKVLKFLLKFSLGRKIILPFLRKPKGAWPGPWLAKTDEERIQNVPKVLETYKDETFYVTEKIDYQSVTFFLREMKVGIFNKKVFGVCSRNLWLKTENDSLYWRIARKYNIEKILREYGEELTIQGEQGDVGVQKNKYGIKEPDFWVFNIIDNRTGEHFSLEEMEVFCDAHGLKMVPVLDRDFKLKPTVADMVEYSKGNSVLAPVKREGIVCRLIKDGKRVVSFKVINPEFLLKYEKED